jgi:hypothetical protein
MLEALKNAVSEAVAALKNNSEHRLSLADALTAAHDYAASLEQRIAALEQKIEAGFQAAGAVAAVVDPIVSGLTQVETKPAA